MSVYVFTSPELVENDTHFAATCFVDLLIILHKPAFHTSVESKRQTAPCADLWLISLINTDTGGSNQGLTEAQRRTYSSRQHLWITWDFFETIVL